MKIFKVASKLFVLIALFFLILCAVFCIYAARITRGAKLDRQKLDTPTKEIVFYDANEQIIETTFLSAREKCTLDEIPQSVKNAFIAIEDKRFYSHDGIDYRRVIAAAINNVKAHSYLEGASTISQQLIKNTHLNSQKTIKRKLTEMKLAKKLEKAYSKDEILTMYLNTIYFGENCYGIKAASQRFFKKKPKELTNAEAATLAAVIKAPSIYSPIRHAQKCEERRNLVLSEMFRQQFISEDQYKEAISVALEVEKEEKAFASDYLKEVLAETEKILRFPLLSYGNSLQIYTGLDPSLQKIVEELDYDAPHNSLFSGMITDSRTALIAAFRSDCGQASRQAGSTLKPLLVYAPAIEYDVIDEATLILDEKTDFSGYVPHNYANKYYGYVSAKEALAKSLNVPAVKTLNAVGIFKSIKIGKKFGLSLTERDDSLVLALGATSGGITLKELSGAYCSLANGGEFTPLAFVKSIHADGATVYMKKDRSTQAISKESAFIVSDMLKESVKNGTAKKLSYLNLPICAKTGTVGTYKGNSDAYTLSYTKDYVVSVWLGATEGAMMSNSVSGGALPAAISAEIWREMSGLGHVFREILPPEGVKKINLDRKIYEEDKKEAEIPAEYEGIPSISAYYKNSRIPTLKSSPFLGITAEFSSVSASYNSICILLCVPEYMEFDLYREELSSKQQTFLCTIAQSKQYSYSDSEVLPGKKYVYHLIPKFRAKNGEYRYGNPVLSDTIITPLPF